MKKAALLTIVLIAAQALTYFNSYAQNNIPDMDYTLADIPLVSEGDNYYIRPHAFDENSFVVMLPISAVLYEYADISCDEGQGRIHVTCGTLDVSIEIGTTKYLINGETAELDAPPEIIGGVAYVPSTFFEKTFGFWMTDAGEGVVDLFMPSFIIDNI